MKSENDRSADVVVCGFTRRFVGCSGWRRDAATTRSRDDCATGFMELAGVRGTL